MSDRTDLIYVYDGSFEGFLTCVFTSFEAKENPVDIISEDNFEPTFYGIRAVGADLIKAERVTKGVINTAGTEAFDYVTQGFLCECAGKEKLILDYIRIAMKTGPRIISMHADKTVSRLMSAVRSLRMEAHHYKGFVRFSDYGGILAAVIEPKNFVLPLLAYHFSDRYPREGFMIYDRVHHAALVSQNGKCGITGVLDYEEPVPDGIEEDCRRAWCAYYETIAIKARENPRCRMTHMPKRFWPRLTEMNTQRPIPQMLGNFPGIDGVGILDA